MLNKKNKKKGKKKTTKLYPIWFFALRQNVKFIFRHVILRDMPFSLFPPLTLLLHPPPLIRQTGLLD